MTGDHAQQYCRNRLFEWTMAIIQFSLGLWLAAFPLAVGASSFRLIYDSLNFLRVNVDNLALMLVFVVVGGFRIVALVANGRWKIWGARIRALGSWAGVFIWLQMAVALVMLIPDAGTPPSPGIPVYFGLAIAELYSTYRARADGNGYH